MTMTLLLLSFLLFGSLAGLVLLAVGERDQQTYAAPVVAKPIPKFIPCSFSAPKL